MGIWQDLKDARLTYRIVRRFKKHKEEIMDEPRKPWQIKRWRQGVGVIVVGLLAVFSGELGFGPWFTDNWETITFVVGTLAGGLGLMFSGAGQARTERMITAAKKTIVVRKK